MSETVKVSAVPTTFKVGTKKYGPFYATAQKPYLDVPAVLQVAASLPLYVEQDQNLAPVTEAETGGKRQAKG